MKSNNNSATQDVPKPEGRYRDMPPPGPSASNFTRQSPSNFKYSSSSPYRNTTFANEASPSFAKRNLQTDLNSSTSYIPISERPSPSQSLYQRRIQSEQQLQQQLLQQQQQQQQNFPPQSNNNNPNSAHKQNNSDFKQSMNYEDLKSLLKEEIREFKEREDQHQLLTQSGGKQNNLNNNNNVNQMLNNSSSNLSDELGYNNVSSNFKQKTLIDDLNEFNHNQNMQQRLIGGLGGAPGPSFNLHHVEQSPNILKNSMMINKYPSARSKEGTPNRSHYFAEQLNIRNDLSSKLQRVSEVAENANEDIKKARDEARALRYELALVSKVKKDLESQLEKMENHYSRQLALEQGENKRVQEELSWHIVREKDLENQLRDLERQSQFEVKKEQSKTLQLKQELESKIEKQTFVFDGEAAKLQEQNAILRREAAWFSVNQQSLENKLNMLQKINNDLQIQWDSDIQRFGLETEGLQNQLSIEKRKNQELQHVRKLTELRSMAVQTNDNDLFQRYQEQVEELNMELENLSRRNFQLETQLKSIKRGEIEGNDVSGFGHGDISQVRGIGGEGGDGDHTLNVDFLKQSTLFQQENENLRAQLKQRDGQVADLNFLLSKLKEEQARIFTIKEDEINNLREELIAKDRMLISLTQRDGATGSQLSNSGMFNQTQSLQIEKLKQQLSQYKELLVSSEQQSQQKEDQIKLLDAQLQRAINQFQEQEQFIQSLNLPPSQQPSMVSPSLNSPYKMTSSHYDNNPNNDQPQQHNLILGQSQRSPLRQESNRSQPQSQREEFKQQESNNDAQEIVDDVQYINEEWTAVLDGLQLSQIQETGWNLRSRIDLNIFNQIGCFVGVTELNRNAHEHSLAKALIHKVFQQQIISPKYRTSINIDVEKLDESLIALVENNCDFKQDDAETLDDFFNEFLGKICKVLVVSRNHNDMQETLDKLIEYALQYGVVSNIIILQHTDDSQKLIEQNNNGELEILTISTSSFDESDIMQIIQNIRQVLEITQEKAREAANADEPVDIRIQLLPQLSEFLSQKFDSVIPIESIEENTYNIKFEIPLE